MLGGSGINLVFTGVTPTGSATGFFNVISNDVSFFGNGQGVAMDVNGTSSLTAFIEKNHFYENRGGVFLSGFNSSVKESFGCHQ